MYACIYLFISVFPVSLALEITGSKNHASLSVSSSVDLILLEGQLSDRISIFPHVKRLSVLPFLRFYSSDSASSRHPTTSHFTSVTMIQTCVKSQLFFLNKNKLYTKRKGLKHKRSVFKTIETEMTRKKNR